MSFQRLPRKRAVGKSEFFFENPSLLPETRAPKEHFKLVFGSGNSDPAKIRPLKVLTSWIGSGGVLVGLYLVSKNEKKKEKKEKEKKEKNKKKGGKKGIESKIR